MTIARKLALLPLVSLVGILLLAAVRIHAIGMVYRSAIRQCSYRNVALVEEASAATPNRPKT